MNVNIDFNQGPAAAPERYESDTGFNDLSNYKSSESNVL